ncbi:OmpA family protein [Maribacter polysaccharolyticus]|uniref:OmpA family protein n=1 Tax=Maribacter polysaccharolyticus TaxID=3020831 RepID=UPI00237FA6B7|nr:OmpA family protein [Maribacter polysaccharolyticus]MDE3742734.1 OmpA family protein [Maribacter polysaccharolyticus]
MKTPIRFLRQLISFLLIVGFATQVNGQILKKLGKVAERAAERTVERRVDSETSKKTDEVLDSILEPGKKEEQQVPQIPPMDGGNDPGTTGNPQGTNSPVGNGGSSGVKPIEVYSKFDYVPGDKLLFFDDFSNDFIGDFPSKWNTNAGGELVTIGDSPQKWFELKSGYNIYFIPDVPKLPEEYTIEFNIMALGLTKRTSSTAHLRVDLSDDQKFKEGGNFAQAHIPFCQYSPIGITIENRINNKREIYSTVKADIRNEIVDGPHVSIAVNKERFRLWVNEVKYIDVPRLVPSGSILSTLKFHANNFKDGEERVFITNLKVAEGGLDLRQKLISEGKVSTNGILFDSGSANIQPQSMGIILQISQVLQQESGMNLNIIGHTDADGDDASNIQLSKERADAVKKALVEVYNIDPNRLRTDGRGESEPVGDNGTLDGKAQNRRVEFVKQ